MVGTETGRMMDRKSRLCKANEIEERMGEMLMVGQSKRPEVDLPRP
jgi:hypothetical protein